MDELILLIAAACRSSAFMAGQCTEYVCFFYYDLHDDAWTDWQQEQSRSVVHSVAFLDHDAVAIFVKSNISSHFLATDSVHILFRTR